MAGRHKVVSSKEWIETRKNFLLEEKEFTRLRDQDEKTAASRPRFCCV